MTLQDEIHDRVRLAPVEVSEKVINELLEICDALNRRISEVEAKAEGKQ
jgi:molecular chaperone GrpE (heat shock protein)